MNDDTDYEDRADYQEQILAELQDINSQLKSRDYNKSRDFSGLLWVFVVVFLIADWGGSWADRWTDRLWYSFKYEAELKNIGVDKRPSDCDWLRSPIGRKCRYEKATNVFGAEQRRQLVDRATTPEEKRQYEQMPNSVTVFWERKSE